MPEPTRWSRDERFARLANVVAAGVRNGEMQAEDALRVLKHQLRIFNRNQAMKVTTRSLGAQQSIAQHDGNPPKNGSGLALHSDHVHPLTRDQLFERTTIAAWLDGLDELREVVCVTADENEHLRRVEGRVPGWAKYAEAGVELVHQHGETWVPLDLLASDVIDADQVDD
jgi:hypothetical protein